MPGIVLNALDGCLHLIFIKNPRRETAIALSLEIQWLKLTEVRQHVQFSLSAGAGAGWCAVLLQFIVHTCNALYEWDLVLQATWEELKDLLVCL